MAAARSSLLPAALHHQLWASAPLVGGGETIKSQLHLWDSSANLRASRSKSNPGWNAASAENVSAKPTDDSSASHYATDDTSKQV